MKVLLFVAALAIASTSVFAHEREELIKPAKHSKEHKHVEGEEADHEHDEIHHGDHDHKAHHPEHDAEAKPETKTEDVKKKKK